jgi:hypothetical protein
MIYGLLNGVLVLVNLSSGGSVGSPVDCYCDSLEFFFFSSGISGILVLVRK